LGDYRQGILGKVSLESPTSRRQSNLKNKS